MTPARLLSGPGRHLLNVGLAAAVFASPGFSRVPPGPARAAHAAHCEAPPPEDRLGPRVRARQVAFVPQAVHISAPRGERRRLFVAQREGAVRVLVDGQLRQEPFIDLSPEIGPTVDINLNERGLHSIAFAPDYSRSGLFYASYSDGDGDGKVTEFRRSRLDMNRTVPGGRTVLEVEHSFSKQHYGGQIAFGPDGWLYVSLGDAQRPELARSGGLAYGKILRINPRLQRQPFRFDEGRNVPPGAVYARGLRNPYRFSFDPRREQLVIGDVGEDRYEELDIRSLRASKPPDFGWPFFEGPVRRQHGAIRHHVRPAVALSHDVAHAVVAGLVVAGRRHSLHRRFLFGDFCNGSISSTSLRGKNGETRFEGIRVPYPTSFAQITRGRLYVSSLSGQIWQIESR